MWREHSVNTWADATGGEGLERSFWKEVKEKNWIELERHIAGNYISIAPGVQLDRAAALEHLRQLQLDEYSLGDFQVELNGQTMVVIYNVTMRGSSGGHPLPNVPLRMMSVWQRQKSGWVTIAHSVIGPQASDLRPQSQ